jgi:acyl carrier protein
MSPIEERIRQFITDSFLYGEADAGLSTEDSLLERGIIDSTGVLELVVFLEKEYGIEINDNELVPANLDSIRNLVEFVMRKTAAPVSSASRQ